MENSVEIPHKIKNRITVWPSNPSSGYIYIQRKWKQDPKVISALPHSLHYSRHAVVGMWKQLQCLSVGEWTKKIRRVHTMEYYSATRKKEMLPFAATWTDLEGIMVSEISQTAKGKHGVISLRLKSLNTKFMETE